ncbi:MAG: macro domain-containing protein [Candidatus Micrarchaeia archaeon]
MKIEVLQGDITRVACDAIVNPANSFGWMGGGVALAIRQAGGEEIEREAVARAPIPVGKAAATTAGKLPAKFVLHAPTMRTPGKTDVAAVRKAVKAALESANELQLESIAFPGMGTGVGGVPAEKAAAAMAGELMVWRKDFPKKVLLVARDEELMRAFEKAVKAKQG